ncbi:MAG: ABC transporter permease, partial [Cyclobacteriaceae bacterium]
MLRNYIVIALRNLLKQKGFSFVKIAGLAFGIAASLMIYLYVLEDWSFNKFNKNHERIVRLLTIDSAEGVSSKVVGVTQPMLGPSAKAELPEVVESVRITGGGRYDLSYEEKTLKSENAIRVDPSFFSVFDVTVVDGPPSGILDAPGSIAITQSLAKKIFGNEPAVGKTLKLNQNTDLHITAVLADPPTSSHLQYDLLRTLVPGQDEQGLLQALESWQGIFCNTYLLLDQPMDVDVLAKKLQAISSKNNAYEFFTPIAQRLDDVHLHSKDILFEINENKSDVQNIYVLSIIGILILVLAAVNFVNLVTANSTMRAKEVGVRKVVGAQKTQLIVQHLVESLSVTFISGIIAVVIVFLIVPILNNVYQRHGDALQLLQPQNLMVMLAIVALLGIVA